MSAIKDGRTTIMLDKQRHLLFSLNVIDEVQDRFQDIEALPAKLQGKDGIKTLRWLLTLLLNEGRDEAEPELRPHDPRWQHGGSKRCNFRILHGRQRRSGNRAR